MILAHDYSVMLSIMYLTELVWCKHKKIGLKSREKVCFVQAVTTVMFICHIRFNYHVANCILCVSKHICTSYTYSMVIVQGGLREPLGEVAVGRD